MGNSRFMFVYTPFRGRKNPPQAICSGRTESAVPPEFPRRGTRSLCNGRTHRPLLFPSGAKLRDHFRASGGASHQPAPLCLPGDARTPSPLSRSMGSSICKNRRFVKGEPPVSPCILLFFPSVFRKNSCIRGKAMVYYQGIMRGSADPPSVPGPAGLAREMMPPEESTEF